MALRLAESWDKNNRWIKGADLIGEGCSRSTYRVGEYVFKICRDCQYSWDKEAAQYAACQNRAEAFAARKMRRARVEAVPDVMHVMGPDAACVNVMRYYKGEPVGFHERAELRRLQDRLHGYSVTDAWGDNVLALDDGRLIVVDMGCDDEHYFANGGDNR